MLHLLKKNKDKIKDFSVILFIVITLFSLFAAAEVVLMPEIQQISQMDRIVIKEVATIL